MASLTLFILQDLDSKNIDEIGTPSNVSIDRKKDEVLCGQQKGESTSHNLQSDSKTNTEHVMPIYDTKKKEEPDLKLIPDEEYA